VTIATPLEPQIDVNLPRVNQGMVALLTGVAFVVQAPGLVGLALLSVAVTRFAGHRYGPWSQIYLRLVQPRLHHPLETEWAAPPRFSQTLAVMFLGLGSTLLALGYTTAGWAVTLVVTALATLAAAARICVGCIVYHRVAAR
jgi:hypothetical protein